MGEGEQGGTRVICQRSPAGHGSLDADAQEGQEGFGEDGAGNQEGGGYDDGAHGIGHQMGHQDLPQVGAGDAFCAGVAIGLTYGKDMPGAIEIGSSLAASVITSSENVCPRFMPEELGIEKQYISHIDV